MCFNSQPPEGGWSFDLNTIVLSSGFNSQPPEGGWPVSIETLENNSLFQLTAARRRLGQHLRNTANNHGFNSQPPEGGWFIDYGYNNG